MPVSAGDYKYTPVAKKRGTLFGAESLHQGLGRQGSPSALLGGRAAIHGRDRIRKDRRFLPRAAGSRAAKRSGFR
jgi:hypothetical protein